VEEKMTIEIVKADSGMDAIIWLILGVLWLIAQAIAKFRGGGREPKPPPILTGEKSLEEDLKTLFEQLSGQSAEPRQPPTSTPPLPPVAKPMKPIPYGEVKRLPKPSPPKREKPRRIEHVQVAPQPAVALVATPHEVHEIPTLSVARSRGGMFKESMFSFNAIKTPLPAAKPLGVNLMGTGAHLRQLVKGRKPLKQAMISRIVLGPPKAFSI
jgi:hypothetical protein